MPDLRELRLKAGYSQVQLANITGLNQNTICDMELGRPCRATSRTLVALALDVAPSDIEGLVLYDARPVAMNAQRKKAAKNAAEK